MIVKCPHCGESVVVSGLGRRRLNIPVKNVLDAIRMHRSVARAAEALGCSRAYVFGVLKANGLKLNDVLDTQ